MTSITCPLLRDLHKANFKNVSYKTAKGITFPVNISSMKALPSETNKQKILLKKFNFSISNRSRVK